MSEIILIGGQVANVDEEDYEAANSFKWSLHSKGYATTYFGGGRKFQQYIMLHQFIGERIGLYVQLDHKDRNKLNCTRSNLRESTDSQNRMNQGVRRDSKTGYKGVTIAKNGRYRAIIQSDHQSIHLGYFSTAILAAKAYNEAAKIYHGEFAYLNELQEG